MSNLGYGIEIDQSMNNTVGGPTSDAFVLVSNNTKGGIFIQGDPAVVPPQTKPDSGNLVQNAYIGTNSAGTAALGTQGNGSGSAGIVIDDSTGNIIGGTLTTLVNATMVPVVDLISGNDGAGRADRRRRQRQRGRGRVYRQRHLRPEPDPELDQRGRDRRLAE